MPANGGYISKIWLWHTSARPKKNNLKTMLQPLNKKDKSIIEKEILFCTSLYPWVLVKIPILMLGILIPSLVIISSAIRADLIYSLISITIFFLSAILIPSSLIRKKIIALNQVLSENKKDTSYGHVKDFKRIITPDGWRYKITLQGTNAKSLKLVVSLLMLDDIELNDSITVEYISSLALNVTK